MNFYPVRFSAVFQKVFSDLIFKKSTDSKFVYLTFDDGPKPEITEWVLDLLNVYNAQATFFCLGNHIERYPDILQKIISQKHRIGNHTFEHLNGWKTDDDTYLKSIVRTEKLINQHAQSAKLFRPPYGRIKPSQIKMLKENNFDIVMWTSISGDFSINLDTKKVIRQLTHKTKPGDILVFHDSTKAFAHLKNILPELLDNLQQKGFEFRAL